MAAKQTIEIVIKAKDNATKVLRKVGARTERVGKQISSAMKTATVPSLALAAGLGLVAKSALDAASEVESSMMGLQSVAKAFGFDMDETTEAAKRLAADGLMTVTESGQALKNLMSGLSGITLEQAESMVFAMKDTAAFNRVLGDFGDAVVTTTKGVRNRNSMLTDSAGIQKNLSIIMEEAGFTIQDLDSEENKLAASQALINGLMEESAFAAGDAAKFSETYAGQVAKLNTEMFMLKAEIGEKLMPVMKDLLEVVSDSIEKFKKAGEWLGEHKEAAVILAGALIAALIPAVWSLVAALVAAGIAIAPFVIVGGWLATMFVLIDKFSKWQTGYGFLDQLKAGFELASAAISDLITTLEELYRKFSDSRWNIVAQIQAVPELLEAISNRQFGGAVRGGQPYIVGERGPEMFVPNQAGRIEPQISGGAPVEFHAHAHIGIFAGNALERRQVAEMLMDEFRYMARTKGRTVFEEIQEGGQF